MSKGNKRIVTPVLVTTSAVLLLDADANRISVLFSNNGAATLYLGKDATLTTSNAGTFVASGANLPDSDSQDAWWGITSSGTADVRIIEVVG